MDIKNRITNEVIYHSDHKTMKETLEAAVQAKADLFQANLWEANLSRANLERADLFQANLREANLFQANLFQANLFQANLREANLERAYLREANLREANLREANLERAYLREANLREADLRGTNLSRADLQEANLSRANLEGASLEGASLEGTDLEEANLSWTCLDPDAQLPTLSDEEIIKAGLEIDGEWVCGWRTKRSRVVGNTIYESGVYTAPVFSIDTNSECHPGIYISGKTWLKENYSDVEIVRCRCRRIELLHAGNKWRCKQLEVL
jgi:hypothetical protein